LNQVRVPEVVRGMLLVGVSSGSSADDDGAELVQLLDFGGGEGAVVDADVVDRAEKISCC